MGYEAKDVERGLIKLAGSARLVKIALRVLSAGVLLIWVALAIYVTLEMNAVASYNLSVANVMFSLLQWVAVAATLWGMSDIFAEIACMRSPFSHKTVLKLRIVAAIAALALVANVLSPAWSVAAINSSGGYFSFSQEPNVVLNLDLETALGALLTVTLFGMSAVFKYGAMLQCVSDDTV